MKRILFLLFILTIFQNAPAQVGLIKRQTPPDDEINLDYRNPKIFEIAEIEITGAQFLDKNALISISSLKVGDKIVASADDEISIPTDGVVLQRGKRQFIRVIT